MNMLRFLLLSIIATTFVSEAMAQRRSRNNNSVRSNNTRVSTRRPTRSNRIRKPRRSTTSRRAPVRTRRSRVNSRRVVRSNRAPIYRNRVPYRHRVRVNQYRHSNRRYRLTNNYYGWLRVNHSNFIFRNWVLYPTSRLDGFFLNQNYPYFVFNGYQHRYSGYDRCNYQLVDGYSNTSVQSYFNQFCNVGYNSCAITRDNLNRSSFSNRYYCAENFR